MRKVISLTFIATALLVAQGTLKVTTLADITGDGATHQIATSGSARWVEVCGLAANGAVIRTGDSSTSSTRGQFVAAGGCFLYQSVAADTREGVNQHLYNLANLYYYAALNDKVVILWAN